MSRRPEWLSHERELLAAEIGEDDLFAELDLYDKWEEENNIHG